MMRIFLPEEEFAKERKALHIEETVPDWSAAFGPPNKTTTLQTSIPLFSFFSDRNSG